MGWISFSKKVVKHLIAVAINAGLRYSLNQLSYVSVKHQIVKMGTLS